uniref:Uncharacterized protein n=1 Tax=Arundo donax TaxID=35708 RepID=A0A0A9G591_ARUDO
MIWLRGFMISSSQYVLHRMLHIYCKLHSYSNALSSKCLKELEAGCNRVKQIFDRFTQNPSSTPVPEVNHSGIFINMGGWGFSANPELFCTC